MTLFHSEDTAELSRVIGRGMGLCGDELIERDTPPDKADLHSYIDGSAYVAFIALKQPALLQRCRKAGVPILHFDRGYYHQELKKAKRSPLWRIDVNDHQTEYIATAGHSPERWLALGRVMARWREASDDSPIVIAGSSPKYHAFHRLPHPTKWAEEIVEKLRQYTNRPIWYRPKPRWNEKEPVPGTAFCIEPKKRLDRVFGNAHALVVHGSFICVEALLSGAPAVVLGNAVTKGISSRSLSEIEAPRLASEQERLQTLSNLSWCQYTMEEWANGFAWKHTKALFMREKCRA